MEASEHGGVAAWDAYAATYQERVQVPTTVVSYGQDIPTEAELHLLGDLNGKRVLDLGCGGGQTAIAFAKQGARVMGVDFSAAQLGWARSLAAAEDVRVDLRQSDLAELAFVRADSIDVVFSAYVFHYVEDLSRVFRQVHRVLKVGATLVFSIPHPAYQMLWAEGDVGVALADPDGSPMIRRAYFDRSPFYRRREADDTTVVLTEYPRTMADIYLGLTRASYRVDLMLEPPPVSGAHSESYSPAMAWVPRTLIVRARKEGS